MGRSMEWVKWVLQSSSVLCVVTDDDVLVDHVKSCVWEPSLFNCQLGLVDLQRECFQDSQLLGPLTPSTLTINVSHLLLSSLCPVLWLVSGLILAAWSWLSKRNSCACVKQELWIDITLLTVPHTPVTFWRFINIFKVIFALRLQRYQHKTQAVPRERFLYSQLFLQAMISIWEFLFLFFDS